jgi:hypothetical protein
MSDFAQLEFLVLVCYLLLGNEDPVPTWNLHMNLVLVFRFCWCLVRETRLMCHSIVLDELHVGVVNRTNIPALHVFFVFRVSARIILVLPVCGSHSKGYFIVLKFMYKVVYLHNFLPVLYICYH